MLSHSVYWYMHFVGIGLLLMSIGGVTLHAMSGGTKQTSGGRVLMSAAHGLGLLLILVAGFGMLARLQIVQGGLPGWVWAKLVVWGLLGALIALPYRRPSVSRLAWFGALALFLVAAWLGHGKPF